jgi:hypothetical protein
MRAASANARLTNNMNTPAQEIIAQVIFWSWMGCFPLSILAFIGAFFFKEKWKVLGMFFIGSILVTHFLWYFLYLGGALATKVGVFHPTPWLQCYPAGFGVAAVLAAISVFRRNHILKQLNPNAQPCHPPLPLTGSGHSEAQGDRSSHQK